MSDFPVSCPFCKASLNDGDIYEHFLKEYNDEKKALETAKDFGWTKEKPKSFSRLIGIYSWEVDRTTHYECPECHEKVGLI